jgi:hypothetical protein
LLPAFRASNANSFLIELSHVGAAHLRSRYREMCSSHVAAIRDASTTLHTVNAPIERIMMTIT